MPTQAKAPACRPAPATSRQATIASGLLRHTAPDVHPQHLAQFLRSVASLIDTHVLVPSTWIIELLGSQGTVLCAGALSSFGAPMCMSSCPERVVVATTFGGAVDALGPDPKVQSDGRTAASMCLVIP